MSKSPKEPWLSIGRELSPNRQRLLVLFSFLSPIILWCIVSYTPFIWHPDVKLDISADRSDVTTVFTAGDHLSKEYFPTFVDAIRKDNESIKKLYNDKDAIQSSSKARRENKKTLRHIGNIAVKNKWISKDQIEDDEALYSVWKGFATGTLKDSKLSFTSENKEIVSFNWEILKETMPEEYSSSKLPSKPLLKLVPQGRSTNPVYLPSPHSVIQAAMEDFQAPSINGKPTMSERISHSIRIIFFGFILSCVFGIPIGILCGTYDLFSKLFEPFIDFFRYMPAPAFSTLLVALFLAHDAPKIALVFVGTFFQMVLVISKTTQLLDKSLVEAAQTLGAKRSTLFTRVIIPGIMPNLYNDLRILLGWSWTWLVIAELIGVKSGLTEFIETQGRWRNFDRVFPVIITIGIIGFTTDQILAQLRPIFFPWTNIGTGKKNILEWIRSWVPQNISQEEYDRLVKEEEKK
jgi:NitT/TauT family transport system permease protein